jgi:hypothetical protein
MMGNRMLVYYERVSGPAFRQVPITEIERRQNEAKGIETPPGFAASAGSTIGMLSGPLANAISGGMAQAHLPPGLSSLMGVGMQSIMGMMTRFGDDLSHVDADVEKIEANAPVTGPLGVTDPTQDTGSLVQALRLIGQEAVGQRKAFLLRADGLNVTPDPTQPFTLQTVSLWIDTEEYVPLRIKIDGTVQSDGETRPVTIERLDTDYRRVNGSAMYVPYGQVSRIKGSFNAKQEDEMRQAQARLSKLDEQIANMSDTQKQMILSRMGPQLATLRTMAAGGGIEVTTEVCEMRPNAGLPDPLEMSMKVLMVGSGCAPAPAVSAGSAPGPGATELAQASAPAASSEKTSDPQGNCHPSVGQVADKTEKKARSFGQFASAISRIVWRSKVAQTAAEAATESDATASAASAVGDLAGDAGGGAGCEPPAK